MSATMNAELFAHHFSRKEIEKISNYFNDYQKNQTKNMIGWDDNTIK